MNMNLKIHGINQGCVLVCLQEAITGSRNRFVKKTEE